MATPPVLWRPPRDARQTTRIGQYMDWLAERRGLVFPDYETLWRWSVDDLGGFWASIWDYFEVISHAPATQPLSDDRMPGFRWFSGATLNYAENALRLQGRSEGEPVVIARSQARGEVTLTAAELRDAVSRARAGLLRLGVQPGDRGAACLPNGPEGASALLATASIGAIWS